jgi:surfeit locus 1 family protein
MTQKFPLWATLFTLIGIIILCGLGTWQINRLHWKETLLADMEAAYQTDPQKNLQTHTMLREATLKETALIHGGVMGRFTQHPPLRSGPRPREEQAGYHLYALFKTTDGGNILVNRGWMPAGQDPLTAAPPPQGMMTLYGLFRSPARANAFTPPNDGAKNYWYRFDTNSIKAHFNIDTLAPYILYVEGPESDTPPYPLSERLEINNNHRFYAFFWFAMAGVLAVIYILRFVITAKQ